MGRALVLVLFMVPICSSGCFSFQRRVEFSEDTRLEVTFENAAAARAFQSAFAEPAVRHSDWKVSWGLAVLVNVEFVVHETEWHNFLVRTADINRDSVITEEECQLLPLPPPSPEQQEKK